MDQLKENPINKKQAHTQSPSAIVGYAINGVVDAYGNVEQPRITLDDLAAIPSIRVIYHNDEKQAARWKIKLIRLGQLREGWNGYEAPAPSKAAISTAETFVDLLVREKYEPRRLAPSVVGGVGVTRRQDNKSVYVEFYNDGKKVFALFSDDLSEPVIKRIEPSYKAFKELIAEMRDYLDA
jgi:hypothetical protein